MPVKLQERGLNISDMQVSDRFSDLLIRRNASGFFVVSMLEDFARDFPGLFWARPPKK